MSTPHRRLAGGALVLVSCCAVQGSAAFSSALFADLGPTAVAAWRQAVGALVLLVLVRPSLRGRTAARWRTIGALGLAMATMNAVFYQAVDRLPLGVAATLLYLGAFVVAASTTRRGPLLLLPALALVGVVLVSRPTSDVGPTGVLLGLLAAVALGAYTVVSHRLGREGGLDDLALAVVASAVVLSPFAAATATSVTPAQWPTLVASGAVGVTLAFTCDFVALGLAGARVVSTLFALDPVVGAMVGAVVLGESLTAGVVAGIVAIVVAGAVTVATASEPPRGATGVS